MFKGDYLSTILRSKKTVFSTKDIALLWREPNTTAAHVRLNYLVKKGELYRIRRGLYAKSKDYDRWELATRILTPCYISFETVLAKEGLIFQYYEPIFLASYADREIVIDGQTYSFRKINRTLLTNPSGIDHKQETSIASKERAFLDTMYAHEAFHFDNLLSLDWNNVFEYLPIYCNKRMDKRVKRSYQESIEKAK